ncbi:MAG TPA: calcium-binding protein [Tepidisphaeraceae bacterium]|nr:calcium-binding protein [Tepidisphaeraceae bacterium]
MSSKMSVAASDVRIASAVRAAAGAGAAVESLETRVMLSAVVSARGTLAVTGTGGDDAITIQRDLKRASKIIVIENGVGTKFDAGTIKRIEMYGLGGADGITLNDNLGIISGRGATLTGGAGNDSLTGGLAGAVFLGGDDADLIKGSSRNDSINGGNGADTVLGGRGQDLIEGGAGNDSLLGYIGNDMVYGDAGNDTLFGEAGDDTLGGDNEDVLFIQGGANPTNFAGNDSLDGGDGNDWLVGGRQSITLNDNNGQDTLTGGAGNDVLDDRGWQNAGGNPDDVITDRAAGDIVPRENHTRVATAQEISDGEDAYAVHDHADLIVKIDTDGDGDLEDVVLQGGIGDFQSRTLANTFARLHVHSGQEGRIHFHDLEAGTITLGEFFRSWGVTLSATHIGRFVIGNGKTLTVTVKHGPAGAVQEIADPVNYVIDGDNIFGQGDIITITYA